MPLRSSRNTCRRIAVTSIAIRRSNRIFIEHVMMVGEAAWRLSEGLKDQNPQVPWKQIEGMRHIMVHDYFKVDWDIVYATAKIHMPALKPQVETMLRSLSDEK
jgi:uncharacterized protein with HEPN domain